MRPTTEARKVRKEPYLKNCALYPRPKKKRCNTNCSGRCGVYCSHFNAPNCTCLSKKTWCSYNYTFIFLDFASPIIHTKLPTLNTASSATIGISGYCTRTNHYSNLQFSDAEALTLFIWGIHEECKTIKSICQAKIEMAYFAYLNRS